MAALITALETTRFTYRPAKLPGGTPPVLTPVRIGGGVAGEMQFTPDRCTAVLTVVGLLPGMTEDSVLADINAVVQAFARQRTGLRAEARRFPGALFVAGTARMPSPRRRSRAPIARSWAQSRNTTARMPSTTLSASPNAVSPR